MIENVILKGALESAAKETAENLGNRNDYLGASDVSQCPTKVILTKFTDIQPDLPTLLNFKRGHLSEDIVDQKIQNQEAFFKEFVKDAIAETPYKVRQQEFVHPEYNFLRAHIDFFFHNKDYSKISIMECKATGNLPDSPYSSWITQLQFQMGLAKLLYPNAEIKGIVYAIDLANKTVEFGPYEPNDTLFNVTIKKALKMWDIYQVLMRFKPVDLSNFDTEVSPLCGYCPFKSDCPRFNGSDVPDELKEMVKKYIELTEQEKTLKASKDALRDQIIKMTGETKLSFDGISVSVKNVETSRVDSKLLKSQYPDIYSACLTKSESLVLKIT